MTLFAQVIFKSKVIYRPCNLNTYIIQPTKSIFYKINFCILHVIFHFTILGGTLSALFTQINGWCSYIRVVAVLVTVYTNKYG